MLSIIVSLTENNAIGIKNKMIFNISEDLKRFKKITNGHTLIMGRKTFESLPYVLPNRLHIVVTKDMDYKVDNENVIITHDLLKTLMFYKELEEECFIIGGATIYKASVPYADKVYLTRILTESVGDTFFDTLDYSCFNKVYESEVFVDKKYDVSFKYIDYLRL